MKMQKLKKHDWCKRNKSEKKSKLDCKLKKQLVRQLKKKPRRRKLNSRLKQQGNAKKWLIRNKKSKRKWRSDAVRRFKKGCSRLMKPENPSCMNLNKKNYHRKIHNQRLINQKSNTQSEKNHLNWFGHQRARDRKGELKVLHAHMKLWPMVGTLIINWPSSSKIHMLQVTRVSQPNC